MVVGTSAQRGGEPEEWAIHASPPSIRPSCLLSSVTMSMDAAYFLFIVSVFAQTDSGLASPNMHGVLIYLSSNSCFALLLTLSLLPIYSPRLNRIFGSQTAPAQKHQQKNTSVEPAFATESVLFDP
ncbi:hypothetical protein EDD21DRAFT_153335 [Dissophora ornata]|nr:hypothetical protein EDD21DRAFT_153335 [Dissophora ornata]